MKLWLAFLVAICFCSFRAFAGDEDIFGSEYVENLTSDNFDAFANQDLSLIEFYAPWCGHCKNLAPEYKEAARILKGEIPLAKVDATKETALASRFGVQGYPTLKVFRNGKAYDYNGPRKASGIVSYMRKQVGPAAKPVNSWQDLETLRKQQKYVVVGFFSTQKSQLHSSFSIVSSKLRDEFLFGKAVNQPELNREFDLPENGEGIIAFFEEERYIYSGTSRTSELEEFIRKHSLPLVGELTEDNQDTYSKRGVPVAKLFMKVKKGPSGEKNMKYFINRLKKIANEFPERIAVAYADKDTFSHAWDHYNFKERDWGFVVEDKDKQYRFEESTFDAKKLIAFVDSVLDGKVKTYRRSEIPPATQEGPVTVVVGSTFDQIVLDNSKDVLIEFYAPWCGHCKALEPKYKEAAEKLKGYENVVVAKIDATSNDFPRDKFQVSGYPTIYFKPAGSQNVKKYEGSREVDDIVKFVKKNAKTINKKKKKKRVISDDEL